MDDKNSVASYQHESVMRHSSMSSLPLTKGQPMNYDLTCNTFFSSMFIRVRDQQMSLSSAETVAYCELSEGLL